MRMEETRQPEETLATPYLVETILRDISDVVNSIDDVQEVKDRIVHMTTDLIHVRTCSLVMIEADGKTLRIGAASGLNDEIIKTYRGTIGEGIGGYVASTGEPLLIEDVETHPLFARKSQKKYDTKSLLSVPLKFQTETIGVLNVNNRLDGGIFTKSDELLLSVLANFVVIAIEKAQMRQRIRETERYEADLRIAREIQESMLPGELPSKDKWEFAARNLPAHEVAGDFYDTIDLPDGQTCIILGDVCGKGVPAAVYMSRVLGYFRVAARVHHTAKEIVSFVNDLLAPEWTERTFVTAVVGVFDDEHGKASFCSAGHQAPVRVTGKGDVTHIDTGEGFPLGVVHGSEFDSATIETSPGDTFLFYTDGVTEATNKTGDMFREDRLDQTLTEHKGHADQLAGRIVDAIQEFANDAPQSDDVTLVVIRRI
jgi:phosphoserine phosphatase RsbU/P